jgi:type II secretory pathway pseudopilin PulG
MEANRGTGALMSIYLARSEKRISLREILIAFGILVVLAVMLSVILMKQKADATRTASSRNLQQWGIALNLYLIDNENQLPEIGADPVTPEQAKAWYNALPPYISQTALADLPEGRRPRPGVPSLWIDPASQPVRVWDPAVFFFNYGMYKFLQPQEGGRSFRIYEINHPANVVFLTETDGYSPAIGPEEVVFRQGGGRPTSPNAEAFVLFCDGHVQPVTRQELVNDPESLEATAAAKGVSWYQK